MSYTYTTYGTTMAKLLAINPSSTLTTDNVELLNAMIDYAELRIYRELDFLKTQKEADTGNMTPGNREIAIPGSILIVNSLYCITPANTAAAAGARNPMQRTSMEFLNFFWPTTATQGQPSMWALKDDQTIVVAPTPDAAYRLNGVGVFRPNPLYTDVGGTFLTTYVPDLFIAASMIFGMGGINANYGAQADDPQSAQSWENQYQLLKSGVSLETLRQKAWGASWQPFSPAPEAATSRTG